MTTTKTTTHAVRGSERLVLRDAGPRDFVVEAHASLELAMIVTAENADQRVTVTLSGDGARVAVYGAVIGRERDILHTVVNIIHAAPRTSSVLHIRSVMDGSASGSIDGRIDILPGSSGCDGRQEIHTLLVGPEASFRGIPELNIGNNDVKSSHAVTTTHIDEVKRFYLESRGMSEQEAVKTIVEGHFVSILDKVDSEEFTKSVLQYIA